MEDFVAFSQYLNFNNVCLAVEGTSSRMHLFHFMQNNLSFSDVTQSRFWIKLVVYTYVFDHSVLVYSVLCILDPNQDVIMSRCNICSPTFLKLLRNFEKKRWKIVSNCVAFSLYLNFIWSQRPCILLQVNFQIPIRMLLCQGATFVLRKPMSTIVTTVTKSVVMTAGRHIVIYWNVKYPESTIKSKEDGID